ncbi:MAG: SUMF1/EgtB/PvdO family nonheme iron enzyme [Candidatus Omnitrophica bacterium]|nr:SUMF1/EgtB/PvdO family nonheme iron enzyme [Candidatus Omnitrophota bacterium]
MKKSWLVLFCCSLCFSSFLFPQASEANDLVVKNVRLGARDVNAKTVQVYFDISWENSWKNKINHDAAWVIVRLKDVQASSDMRLCQLASSGLNPSGTLTGNNADIEVYVPQDKTGAFIRRVSNQPIGPLAAQNALITVNYDSCGFTENSQIQVAMFGFEMVYVPEGSFYAGDGLSVAALRQGASDNNPWHITSEFPINVSAADAAGFYYTSAGNIGELPTGSVFTVPAAFPKGYAPFYMMKYELTEGQWIDFVNSLSVAARAVRDITNASHKNSDAVLSRNTIACSGPSLICATQRPHRPVSFIDWQDLAAFLDWAALRPMTELEFEKAARGPYVPLAGEYAWGSKDITAADTVSGTSEEGDESVTTPGANARFNGVMLSGGDSRAGVEYQKGMLRSGIFSTGSSNRILSGAGNYGAMDLSGNAKEMVVTLGNPDGLAFSGQQGSGYLTTLQGSEGNANVPGWPGMDTNAARGVTGASGAGLRGGSWADVSDRLRISDRQEAALMASSPTDTLGGRGVRTYDGL